MYKVVKQISFCYGHRLINYRGKCQHLHGHDAVAEIELATKKLDHRGMVMDFIEIKRRFSAWIDTHLDHQMLLHQDDPLVPILQQQGEPLFLMPNNPTAENIAQLLFEQAKEMKFPVVEVRVWESPSSCASYNGLNE